MSIGTLFGDCKTYNRHDNRKLMQKNRLER